MGQRSNQCAEIPTSAAGRQSVGRRIEAERLIDLAKALLTEPEEEIAAIYLDHAVDALRMIAIHPVS
ncbi:hypothetical protein [Stakelama pacifica]|uniref:Uncharacterized protein n=1 Tax=Stakelama pacifica TaxID=517720 RepID=A0A4R6FB75_9SPHN|nr:hypothetical protein [Stakelama pacifica]TDN78267.1 hypothetical protein EV664_11826 [Stakelama pacifica]GGO99758.1 hypothetical protein GCM10011329_33990 [Stakelama pacifica]